MTVAQRVLVVDGLSETEAVLRAVLEPKGLEVDRIRGVDSGVFSRERLAAKERPSLVVLHVEGGPTSIPTTNPAPASAASFAPARLEARIGLPSHTARRHA